MTTDIKVENIKCGGCMNSIKTSLLKIDNGQEVSIEEDTETIHISSKLTFDRNQITNKLAKLGFPETGKNNVLRKVKSYVSCAIGKFTEKP